MMQCGVRHHGIEVAQFASDVEDVAVLPVHRRVREALLGPLQNRLVDVDRDHPGYAPRQARGQEPVATSDVKHGDCVIGNGRVELGVVMNVDIPRRVGAAERRCAANHAARQLISMLSLSRAWKLTLTYPLFGLRT